MSAEAFAHKMSQYMPEAACPVIYGWLQRYPARLRITKPRNSKLGDFRVDGRRQPPLITVNGNLNAFSFTITLTHEIAHLIDYAERGTLREPHGPSWKKTYSALLKELLAAGTFPSELVPALQQHVATPKAASCSDPTLMEALRVYDDEQVTILKDIPDGGAFALAGGRVFEKGELRRTRYRCREVKSGKYYLIHGQSEVEPIAFAST